MCSTVCVPLSPWAYSPETLELERTLECLGRWSDMKQHTVFTSSEWKAGPSQHSGLHCLYSGVQKFLRGKIRWMLSGMFFLDSSLSQGWSLSASGIHLPSLYHICRVWYAHSLSGNGCSVSPFSISSNAVLLLPVGAGPKEQSQESKRGKEGRCWRVCPEKADSQGYTVKKCSHH